jgi:formate hydrogenlyase subunit 3/multisubunit Na+/H+ antiporter MnhD subunit
MEVSSLKQIKLHIVINSEKTFIIIIIIIIIITTHLYCIQWHTKAQNSKHYDVSAMLRPLDKNKKLNLQDP